MSTGLLHFFRATMRFCSAAEKRQVLSTSLHTALPFFGVNANHLPSWHPLSVLQLTPTRYYDSAIRACDFPHIASLCSFTTLRPSSLFHPSVFCFWRPQLLYLYGTFWALLQQTRRFSVRHIVCAITHPHYQIRQRFFMKLI
jgi:hypothetical protein